MNPAWLVVRLKELTINQAVLFMCKERIFKELMEVVSEITGISESDILLSRTEECTDARYLLVKYLWRFLPCACIGELIGRTRQGVRSIMQREKGDTWLMVRNWKEIVKRMESKGYESK